MGKAHSIVAALLLASGLAACDRSVASAENASPAEAGLLQAAPGGAGKLADGAVAASSLAPLKSQDGAPVSVLPLRRGYYVATDTPCSQASNATVMLLRREGIGGARDFCEFRRIEKTGPHTYRVTEACGDLQDAAAPEISITTYTLTGETAFSSRSELGWERSARYCAQSAMPPDFRANDISDVIR